LLDFQDLKYATNSQDFDEDDFIAPGDLLLIRTNGSIDLIGRAAIVKTTPKEKCSFASYLIRYRLVGDEAIWSWVSLAWDSDVLRSNVESRAVTTAGQYNLSLSRLGDLAIPLPPVDEINEIVREVGRRFSAADQLDSTLERQLELAQTTRQSLMREAFAGRLVPRDPNDEPASALLERIRAARKAEAKKPRAKRMPKTKTKDARRPLLEVLREHKKPMTPEQLFAASGYQQEFKDSEYRQEIVERFYDELRRLVGPDGPVLEKRPNRTKVSLEVRS
jgi:type I restriction enzyme S subunit